MKVHVHDCGIESVFRHLALEELLLEEHAPDRVDLLFYRCAPCVVLGKNQNPWRECQPGLLGRSGIAIARRMSGGGAVYHDTGNLNVSFLVPRAAYDPGKVMRIFLDALGSLDIWAACPDRSRLVWNNAKISGQAFAYRRERVLHHGTLLLRSDLQALQNALKPSDGLFTTAAVASKPSAVANLTIPEADVIHAITRASGRMFGVTPEILPAPSVLLSLGQDWPWVYGRTPEFHWQRFLPGEQSKVDLRVEAGRLVSWSGGALAGIDLPGKGVRLFLPDWMDFLSSQPEGVSRLLDPLLPPDILPG